MKIRTHTRVIRNTSNDRNHFEKNVFLFVWSYPRRQELWSILQSATRWRSRCIGFTLGSLMSSIFIYSLNLNKKTQWHSSDNITVKYKGCVSCYFNNKEKAVSLFSDPDVLTLLFFIRTGWKNTNTEWSWFYFYPTLLWITAQEGGGWCTCGI